MRGRARGSGRDAYRRLASAPGFDAAVIAFFVGQLILKLAYGAILIFVVGLGWRQVLDVRFVVAMMTSSKPRRGVATVVTVGSPIRNTLCRAGVVAVSDRSARSSGISVT